MATDVVGQWSANATSQAYGLKVGKQLSFAHRIGKYLVISSALLLRVKGEYLLRYRMQGYQTLDFRFLYCLADIPLPFAVRFDLRSSQAL